MADDALTAAVAEALAAHQYVPSGLRGVSRCACGAPFHGMPHYHRAHAAEQVARVVREHTAAKQAEAWDDEVSNTIADEIKRDPAFLHAYEQRVKKTALREAAEALLAEYPAGPDGFDRPGDAMTPTVFAIWLQRRADRLQPEPAPDGGEL